MFNEDRKLCWYNFIRVAPCAFTSGLFLFPSIFGLESISFDRYRKKMRVAFCGLFSRASFHSFFLSIFLLFFFLELPCGCE